jgi:hypothetical protein
MPKRKVVWNHLTNRKRRVFEEAYDAALKRGNSRDDPQPSVGALGIALAPHRLDHLARLGGGLLAVLGNPPMRGAMDIEVGGGRRRERSGGGPQ